MKRKTAKLSKHVVNATKGIDIRSSSTKAILCVDDKRDFGCLSGPSTMNIELRNVSEKPDRFLCRVKMKNVNSNFEGVKTDEMV